MSKTTEPPLREGAIWRIARKVYRCTAADEFLNRWQVRGEWPKGHTISYARTYEEAAATAQRMEDSGPRAGETYESVVVEPVRNRNFVSRDPGCLGDIAPGDRYVEYLGEALAYQSGTRYCRVCGSLTWAAEASRGIAGKV